jgi:hypothetical protein
LAGLAGAGAVCPNCGTPQEGPTQVFCEVCGHNFRTGTGGGAPQARAAPATPPAVARPPIVRWDVVVRVDAGLGGQVNAKAPVDQPPQTFTLFEVENMIGREGSGLRVQVPIRNDPGVSRRHALLIRQPDGGLVLRDLNSANGTRLNEADVVPGEDLPLRDGDTIVVGAWTRIAVRAVLG